MVMERSRGRWRLIGAACAAAAAVVWLAGATLGADYKDSYRKGIEAINAKRWSDAERLMQAALAEQPREGGRVNISGNWWEPYIPHYYLGVARSRSGDCAGAVSAWRTSELQGFIKSLSEYTTLRRGVKECEPKLAGAGAPAGARGAAEPPPATGKPATGEKPAGGPTGPSPAGGGTPATTTPTRSPTPREATPAVPSGPDADARRNFDSALTDVHANLAGKRFGVARAAARRAKALRVDDRRADAAMRQVDVEETQEQLRVAIEGKRWVEGQRLVARLEELSAPAETTIEPKAAIARGLLVAGLERQALSAFYHGDYRGALTMLERATSQDPRPSPRDFLYMACSEAALALLDGRDVASRMEHARALFARARPQENDFSLDRQYISPRLLRELEGGR